MKSVSFHTLGCKLNFSETSTLARQLEAAGYRRAQGGVADLCIVNTCSVTEHADKKCRNLIRRLVRENPGAVVAVTGCYAALKPDAIAEIEGVGLVCGDKGELVERLVGAAIHNRSGSFCPQNDSVQPPPQAANAPHFPLAASRNIGVDRLSAESFFPAYSSGDRTRTFLKVQDGCDYHCSYCTIPRARGASRNIPIADIVGQAREIAAAGQREIVLTGVNTGDFGRTTGENFLDLLKALDAVEGIERYRISSIEPNLLTDEIIAFTAFSPKFQPHFHIPLQSGCDRILGLMRRRYNTAKFAERVFKVREAMPEVFIGVDVIVGFPGETEEDFAETMRFIEQVRPAFLHVFPFSARPETPAFSMSGQVAPAVSAARVKRLTELSDLLHAEFCALHGGGEHRVLWEDTRKNGMMSGFTENYIKVSAPWDVAKIGMIEKLSPKSIRV